MQADQGNNIIPLRTETMEFWVTDEEFEFIETTAKRVGMNLEDYTRETVLKAIEQYEKANSKGEQGA
jgi:KaiC/GvpD/RAD55 family RecA-like ATPase